MRTNKLRAIYIILGLLAVAGSYAWACYVEGACTCAVIGGCYGSKVVPDCQMPTCVIADSTATVWNACPGPGPYPSRQIVLETVPCCPPTCRFYNNCTHQYIGISGSICCFDVRQYFGTGSGCQ